MKRKKVVLTGLLLAYFLLGNAELSVPADTIDDSALGKGRISGDCFNDKNGNNIKDVDEGGVEGANVSLQRLYFLLFPREVRTATTGEDGRYEFINLGVGFYSVEVTNTSNAECTTKNPVLTFIGFFRNIREIAFGFSVSALPAPTVSITADPEVINRAASSTLTWTAENAETVTIDQGIGAVDASGSLQVTPEQTTTYTITAQGSGGTATASVTITVNIPQTSSSTTSTIIIIITTTTVVNTTSVPVTSSTSTPPTTTVQPTTSTSAPPSTTTTSTGGLPPNPADVAPPLDNTVATNLYSATEFLYAGDNPIQTGVEPGTIEPVRAAVLRGKVLDREGNPLSWVAVSILNHPEYGQTLSREDGMFDLAVNGGGYLTVNYARGGYLTAQRQVNVPWQDYVWAPDVVLISLDTQVTQINLNAPDPIQVARGSIVTDDDGTRQATLLISQGTTARMVMPDGSTEPLTSLSIRVTEYTVGPNGPKAMPAELPPTSGYTYCVELSADEAIAAGATAVSFNQPLYTYVDDFIGFPVGSAVPSGYYDKLKGQWIASENGRVINILSISDGLAVIDTNGDENPDDAATLLTLGISDAERQQLAAIYSTPPEQLWRIPITHFSPYDCNWPYGPPEDAVGPDQPFPSNNQGADQSCPKSGSIIECQNQTLGERVAVAGTPFALNYRSSRMPGYPASRTLKIPLSGSSVPATLRNIQLEITIAGKLFSQSFAAGPSQSATFVWDGMDAYGRPVQGSQTADVRIGYIYPMQYYAVPSDLWRSFTRPFPGGEVRASRNTLTIWQNFRVDINRWDGRSQGLGGWSLDVHHAYDPAGQILYLGNGERRSAVNQALVIDTVAGNGYSACAPPDNPCGDGGPATDAPIGYVYGVTSAPDGSLYLPVRELARIRRVSPDGIITTVAGSGQWCTSGLDSCGDGGPATEASFGEFYDAIGLGSDGSIYIAEPERNRVRRVGPDGIITTIAGTGVSGFSGDGGLATEANLNYPQFVAAGPDGSVYIVDAGNYRIRRVGPDGYITTVAGNGTGCYPNPNPTRPCGDGGPATEASLYTEHLFVAGDGTIYFGSYCRVRKVTPDGIISNVAGTGECGFGGDGGSAADAKFGEIRGIAPTADDALLVVEDSLLGKRVRRISPNGIVSTVAGTEVPGYSGDGGPAAAASFRMPWGIAVGPDGYIYIADVSNSRIRRLRPFLPAFSGGEIAISSEDGREFYIFDEKGRHLKTLNTLTGAVVYEFTYDADGKLLQITDGYNNTTNIERDNSGDPTAIAGPYGQRTTLSLDANGCLASITNPEGETASFAYSSEGLMTSMTTPRGHDYLYTYDSAGLLSKDENPAGGYQSLTRTELTNGYEVTLTTAAGETDTYRVETLPTGDKKNTYTSSCCGTSEVLEKLDGTLVSTSSDGTVSTMVLGPDPRFGMQSPIVAASASQTPGGLTRNTTMNQTVSLSNSDDPLSLLSVNETTAVNGRTYTSFFDTATRTRTNTSPAGRQTLIVTDALERVTGKQVAGLDPVSLTYDSRGRLATITSGSGGNARISTFTYNSQGLLAIATDPVSRSTNFEYDAAGRLTGKTLPDGRVVSFAYDANGNLTSITPPGRPVHVFTYDTVNLLEEYFPPAPGAGSYNTTYAYNPDKKLTTITRPDGMLVNYGYTPGGKLQTVTTPDGTYSHAYDPASKKLTSITSPDGGTLSFTYDGELLLAEVWEGDVAGRIDSAYDNDFRINSRSVNSANSISFGYDDDGLLIQAGNLSIARNPLNGFISGSTLGSVTDIRGHNAFRELQNYAAFFDASPLLTFQYVRDKLGRVTEKTETVGGLTDVYSYAYDTAGRLTTVTKNANPLESYTYDSNSNRLTFTGESGTVNGTYDDQDRLLQYGDTTYTYTANGELQTKTVGGQTTTYDYDALGNLLGATLPSGTQVTYVIDGLNRRIGKKVNGLLVQGFLYENLLHPAAELDGAGNVVSRFIYGTRSNVPDYLIHGANTYRIISDHLGSPRLIVDTATGEIAQQITYDSFGNILSDTNQGFQPFGFAGGLYDQDTKLARFGVRDYDAETGRWTAKDPIRFDGLTTNLYGYVFNDPVNLLDPNGKIAPAIAIAAAEAGAFIVMHPEMVNFAVGFVQGVVQGFTETKFSYERETIVGEFAGEKTYEAIHKAYEQIEETERLIERVRQMREEAEMTREQLEKLLEDLYRMFPCRKRKR